MTVWKPWHQLRRTWSIVVYSTGILLAFSAPSANAQFTVSGTVTDTILAAVDSVSLSLFDTLGTPIGIPPTITNALGFYSIVGLPPGVYRLEFKPKLLTRLIPQSVTVSIVGNTTLNIVLNPGIIVSGVISDSTGAGIFNIDLNMRDRNTGVKLLLSGDNSDLTGFYDVVVPTGEYLMSFRGVDSLTVQWIPVAIKPSPILADTTINISMIEGIFVTGTITDDLAQPVMGANLDFVDSATGAKIVSPGDNTDSLGVYSVHIPALNYDVRIKAPAVDTLMSREVLSVPVLTSMTLNYSVVHGVALSGTVRDPLLLSVEDVDVDANDVVTGAAIYLGFDNTDEFGNYQVVVPSGNYDLVFEPPAGLFLAAQEIQNVSLLQHSVLNVALQAGVTLSGFVLDNALAGVANIDIDAKVPGTSISIPLIDDSTDSLGAYKIVLPAGNYDLEFEPAKTLSLVAQKSLNVAIPINSIFPNVVVPPGFSLSGTSTDSVGAAVSRVDIRTIISASGIETFSPGRSDAFGNYLVIIAPGIYNIVCVPDTLEIQTDSVVVTGLLINQNTTLNVAFGALITTDTFEPPLPRLLTLHVNVPNPFNPSTVIRYDLERSSQFSLTVYDARGIRVRSLFDGFQSAGNHLSRWDGRDGRGDPSASGVYFYVAKTPDGSLSRKMLLLK